MREKNYKYPARKSGGWRVEGRERQGVGKKDEGRKQWI